MKLVKTKGKDIVLLDWVGFFSFQIYDWIDPFIVNIRIVNPQGVVYLGLKPSGKQPPSG